jgi:hypothetical protein
LGNYTQIHVVHGEVTIGMPLVLRCRALCACLALALGLTLLVSPVIASAALTGQVSGTVTDGVTHAPVAGAKVIATSPSGAYSATTDPKGGYALVGVAPDTYTVTFAKQGYAVATVTGVTVLPDDTKTVDGRLTVEVRTLSTVTVRRSASSAYQPNATETSYAVTSKALQTQLGKSFNTDESALLSSLPSVTKDSAGTIKIRGGFDFQTAYQFEGIDYTLPNASLQSRAGNVANFNLLNGVGSLQLVPGGGDSSHGDTGTGLIALSAKRGTYPAFGLIDFEADVLGGNWQNFGDPLYHQAGFEYGTATPNGRWSEYIGFTGVRQDYQYGPRGSDVTKLASLIATTNSTLANTPASQQQADVVNNLLFRFGSRKQEQLQFFYQRQDVSQELAFVDTLGLQNSGNVGHPGPGLLTPQQQLAIYPVFPGASAPGSTLGSNTFDSPFTAFKLEYSDTFGPSAFGTLRFYRAIDIQRESLPQSGLFTPANGGSRSGVAAEISAQAGSKNYVEFGGKFDFAKPFGTTVDVTQANAYAGGYQVFTVVPVNGFNHIQTFSPLPAFDFLPATSPACPFLYHVPASSQTIVVPCGYLSQHFSGAVPRLPAAIYGPTVRQQIYAWFAQDTIAVSPSWKVQAGLRLDGYNFLIPDDPSNPPTIAAVRHQRLFEPHIGITHLMGPRDSIRATFGRTLSIPLPSFLGSNVERNAFAAFRGIPSFDNLTGKAAMYCGLKYNLPCTDYADQLYWVMRDVLYTDPSRSVQGLGVTASPPAQPLHGATFSNYDITYSHDFGHGLGLRLTPFYRRGYDIVENSRNVVAFDPFSGAQTLGPLFESNLGIQKATGVEFDITQDADIGLSGQFSATYINQIGNDPPGQYLPTASLALGNLYHSPNLSPLQATLALNYRTRSGWRINPVISVNDGYPAGIGLLGAFYINGVAYNVPNTDAAIGNVNGAPQYVDPQNPGTLFNPNIVATRGVTEETSAAGGFLSKPSANVNVTFEYTQPGSRRTFGLAVDNVFNQLYGVPLFNHLYVTPVSTGVRGPGNGAAAGYPLDAFPTSPYVIVPFLQPTTYRLYVQERL